ncbi:hypothetical protein QZH41_005146 [Actinostola sp. cb2023]|nr:hypothetical protein QZH41_005146 [Actinostola sp. cb2023]
MAKIEARTTKLEEFEASARNEMGDLKSAITFCDNSVTSLEVKLKEELETLKSENEVLAKELEAKIEDLKSKDLYLEAYSRRENTKFMNINEEDDENAEKVIRSFLRDKLNYSDCDEVEIQRVHRNPARKSMNRATPRPILSQPALDNVSQFAKGYEDYLQCPLQPLSDNLESQTYEIFERDPIKYTEYQKAVYEALMDRVPDDKKSEIVTFE